MPKHSKYNGFLPQENNYRQDMKDFGANVRKYRETQGLSLDALSNIKVVDKERLLVRFRDGTETEQRVDTKRGVCEV